MHEAHPQIANRAVAVEQEGYGVMRAAHEAQLPALVIRGVSDLIDDKSDADQISQSETGLRRVDQYNYRQLTAARHAAAFAFYMLSNLDVSWLPSSRGLSGGLFGEPGEVTLNIACSINQLSGVIQQLNDFRGDLPLNNIRITISSVILTFETDPTLAIILENLWEAGLLDMVMSYQVTKAEAKVSYVSSVANNIKLQILTLGEDDTVRQDLAIRSLEAIMQEHPKYAIPLTTVINNFRQLKRQTSERSPEPLLFNENLLNKVDTLGLSRRTMNLLKSDNIVFVGDLVQQSESELLRTPNFARKALNEIKEVLARIGLHLDMEITNWPPENTEELQNRFNEMRQEGKLPIVLLKHVGEVGLRLSTVNRLKANNISSVASLVEKSESELLRLPNFGRQSLNEVKEFLTANGLQLGMAITKRLFTLGEVAEGFADTVRK